MTSKISSQVPRTPKRDSTRGGVALLILDMINCFDFKGGKHLQAEAEILVPRILQLRRAMDKAQAPVIYVNDNFAEWHSEKSKLIARARKCSPKIVTSLEPRNKDFFILKPQFSGFYATNLPVLLPKLGVSHLILTGVAADICILFSAADAHMRDYALWVPQDAVAAEQGERLRFSLDIMQSHLGAEIAPSTSLDVKKWIAQRSTGTSA